VIHPKPTGKGVPIKDTPFYFLFREGFSIGGYIIIPFRKEKPLSAHFKGGIFKIYYFSYFFNHQK
jgi:hypothetical protein